ncbi:MAG: hypothetical protein DRP27_05900 [Thermotogae bacterium]|nr:MAG: hypothetical protein DRP27_05900 [Thermotogota bacterium]
MNARCFFLVLVVLIACMVVDNVSVGFLSRLLIQMTTPGVEATGHLKAFFSDFGSCLVSTKSGVQSRPAKVKVLTLHYGTLTLLVDTIDAHVGQLVLVKGSLPLGKVVRVDGSLVTVQTLWSRKLQMPVRVDGGREVVLFRGGYPPTVEALDDSNLEVGALIRLVEYPALPEASSTLGRVGQRLGGGRYSVEVFVKPDNLPGEVSLFP